MLLNYMLEPPSRRALKQHFLDAQLGVAKPQTLNCVAHLILTIDEPQQMAEVALEYIVTTLGACRADLGFVDRTDPIYDPHCVHYNRASASVECDEAVYPNRAGVFQRTWRQGSPVTCDDVSTDPLLADSRAVFDAIQSKSILFQRLAIDSRPVGLTCVDFTHERHVWTADEARFMQDFCQTFLGPLAAIGRHWHAPRHSGGAKRPTPSELAAIRLAATGLSYKRIADELGKSVRTIENQLRSARCTVNAANQAELITKCEAWL